MEQNDQPQYTGPSESEFQTKCQFPGCPGIGIEWRIISEGWYAGMMIPEDPTNPQIGLCPKCRRHQMMVVRVPDLPPVNDPRGFWRFPTK